MDNYDVIVAGGGFSGASAAISAAREGARVLLIEKSNCLGGAAGNCQIFPFMPYWTQDTASGGKLYLSRGIFREIVEKMRALGAMRGDAEFLDEYLKLVLNRMALEAGVKLLFRSCLTSVELQGDRIQGVTVSNVSGQQTFHAACFVDATGDGQLACLAGVPYQLGRSRDSLCQPMTLCFRVANVDTEAFQKDRKRTAELYRQFRQEGKIKNCREDILAFPTMIEGVWHFNSTRICGKDPTDAWSLTEAEIEAREQVFELFDFLKEEVPAFAHAQLLSTASEIGVRESRKIEGEYLLTQEDLLACTRFEDAICTCNYDIDIHNPEGTGTSHYLFPAGAYYTIPYRCMLPRNRVNLLVTGRCISATHEAQASLRIMPTCACLGEAAGVAAAMASASVDNEKASNMTAVENVKAEEAALKGNVKAVDVKVLRQRLRELGAMVD